MLLMVSCAPQKVRDHITDITFVVSLENAVKLLEPILALLQSLEADKPLLSQCLPAWYSICQHVKYWCEEELQCLEDVMPVMRNCFLKKCYHPAMAAAFLMDPVFWKKDPNGDMYTPDKQMIDKMDACLEIDVWKDARKVIVMTIQNACMMLARWLC